MSEHADDVLQLPEPVPAEVPLPTFVLLARFASTAEDERGALADVRARLQPVRELFDDLLVERREDDGTWLVLAQFHTVSVEPQTAVVGVHESLTAAGISADEVWVAS